LWDDKQYEEEFDLDGFLKTMKWMDSEVWKLGCGGAGEKDEIITA